MSAYTYKARVVLTCGLVIDVTEDQPLPGYPVKGMLMGADGTALPVTGIVDEVLDLIFSEF